MMHAPSRLLGLLAASVVLAASAHAQEWTWGSMAVVSETLGANPDRVCVGAAASRRPGDLGCPTYAPSVSSAGLLTATNVSATAIYSNDAAAYFYNNFIDPSLVFDTNDYLRFNRLQNRFDFLIAGVPYLRITDGGISTTALYAGGVSVSGIITATTRVATAEVCDENGANCVAVGDLGSAEGDRIISGSLSMVAISATGYVSLTTGATNWGYLNQTLSYLPTLWSGRVSATNVSTTTAQFAGTVVTTLTGSGGNKIVSGTTNVTTTSDGNITFVTNNNQRLVVDVAGQVGIATATPNATLDVAGLISTSSLTVNGVAITANGGAATAASSTGAIQFNVANGFAGDGANLFWDDTNNRLGVGTVAPAEFGTLSSFNKIAVDGSSISTLAIRGSGNPNYFSVLDLVSNEATDKDWFITHTNSGLMGINSLAFGYYNGTTTSFPVMIGSSGNVGIGTTEPGVRLDVSGTIVSRVFNAGSGTSIDFSQANVAYTSAACGAFTLSNMQDGGSYSLIVKGSGTGPATFTHTGLTVKTTATLTCTSAKHTVFSFLRAGTDLYVTFVTGY